MAGHHFHDREIIAVARELPVVLTNVFGSGGVESPTDHDEKNGACTRYGGVPCAVHQAYESYCVEEFIGPDVAFQVPKHIVISPSGQVLMHRTYYLSERDLVRMMIRALRHVNPKRSLELARRRLQPLRHGLVSSDSKVRSRSVEELVLLVNSGDEYAVCLLGDLVTLGVAASDRVRIADGLIPDAVEMLDTGLAPMVSDPDPVVRFRAVQMAARAADDLSVVRLLTPLVVDPDSRVRGLVRARLGISELSSGVTVIADPHTDDRWRIVQALVREGGARTVDGLASFVADAEPHARHAVLRTLARQIADPEARKLVRTHAAEQGVSAIAALRALRAHLPEGEGRELLELASRQFGSANGLVREEAMELAAAVGGGGASRILREGLEDWVPAVQVSAALGLLPGRDPECIPVLLEHVGKGTLGARIQSALLRAFERGAPGERSGWREWCANQGLIQE